MRWDAVIAGGGASGLSLACHLAAGGWADRRVAVVDDGLGALAGRRWAHWSVEPGLLGGAVSRSYASLLVHAGGAAQRVALGPYRYRVVRGADLQATAGGLLAAAPGFELLRGHVEAVADEGDEAVVVVDGQPLRARWAFDSVLSRPVTAASSVRLTFVGWDVEVDDDVFDPEVPTLMDFRTPQEGEARFVYVLPSSARRALVEHTRFGSGGAYDAAPALTAYLDEVLGARSARVLGVESGDLALAEPLRRPTAGRVLPIGLRGGMLKASTGYAYTRIQRDSAAITASLARTGHPFDLPAPSARHRYLDAVLLQLLAAEPERVQEVFAALFARNPGQRVLRFLDEDTSVLDEARLVAGLPRAPFVRAAGRISSARPEPGRRPASAR